MQLSTNNNDNVLSSNERARYKRHLALDGFGEEGQIRLKNSSVIFIGAGGLGLSAIIYMLMQGLEKLELPIIIKWRSLTCKYKLFIIILR